MDEKSANQKIVKEFDEFIQQTLNNMSKKLKK